MWASVEAALAIERYSNEHSAVARQHSLSMAENAISTIATISQGIYAYARGVRLKLL